MQVVLEQISLPEKGHVEFGIHRSFDILISSEEARTKVKRWLWSEISILLGVGTPSLLIDEQVVWRVPVTFNAPGHGQVGAVGTIDVTVESGELLQPVNQRAQIESHANALASRLADFQPYAHVPGDSIAPDVPPAPRLNLAQG